MTIETKAQELLRKQIKTKASALRRAVKRGKLSQALRKAASLRAHDALHPALALLVELHARPDVVNRHHEPRVYKDHSLPAERIAARGEIIARHNGLGPKYITRPYDNSDAACRRRLAGLDADLEANF